MLEVFCVVYVGKPPTLHCVVVGLPTCCCWFTNNKMLLLVYQHVVVGLPTCCCWFTNNNMLLLVYQHVVVGKLLLAYQHVVVGLPTTTCCCWYILQPTPATPTHQGIPWNVEGFPLSWCVVFPSVILSLHVMIVLHCLLWIKPGDQDGPDCRNVSRVYRSIIETIHLSCSVFWRSHKSFEKVNLRWF